jgi:hypothetical protein
MQVFEWRHFACCPFIMKDLETNGKSQQKACELLTMQEHSKIEILRGEMKAIMPQATQVVMVYIRTSVLVKLQRNARLLL